jgi:hypothetical protein
VRSLSPVEAALCVAIGGSVLAVGVPSFVRNLHASRLVEPIDGLNRIAAAAAERAAAVSDGAVNVAAEAEVAGEGSAELASSKEEARGARAGYPPSVGPTPRAVPLGAPTLDPPGTWDEPTWKSLAFGFTRPHSFEFQSEVRGRKSRYRAFARGDLDGDGQTSEFSVRGEATSGAEPLTYPLEMHREIE